MTPEQIKAEKRKAKLKCVDIELMVSSMFGIRQNIIVPNISWGAGLHECDLIVIRKSGWAYEVEIKVSKQDLLKDLKKKHAHISDKIQKLYYAMPSKLIPIAHEVLPAYVGLIDCSLLPSGAYHAFIRREARACQTARKMNQEEILNVARLGTMRIWNLKRKLTP